MKGKIKRKFSVIFILMIILSILIGVSGCMSNRVKFKNEVREYLAANYPGETFTYGDVNFPVWMGAQVVEIHVYPEGYDGQRFTVSAAYYKETKTWSDLWDDYYVLQLADEALEYFQQAALDCGIDGVVKIGFKGEHWRPEGLSSYPTFEEYLSLTQFGEDAYIFSDSEIEKEKQKEFVDKMVSRGLNVYVAFYEVKEGREVWVEMELDALVKYVTHADRPIYARKDSYYVQRDGNIDQRERINPRYEGGD